MRREEKRGEQQRRCVTTGKQKSGEESRGEQHKIERRDEATEGEERGGDPHGP